MAATEISVDHIARVEGHGDIRLVIEDGQVTTCEMAVVEPARLFESMVRGRSFEEVPYIASRVCGICSSSHVVTDLRAIEQVFGVEVTDRTEALRELLLYGSYLQNHGTHLFVFAAPDFLGHKSVFPLAEGNPELFERALGLKALGNELCTLVGGRSIHPITAVVGGFTHEISADEYLRLAEAMDATREFALASVDLFRDFDTVDVQTEGDLLAMVAPDAYPVCTSDTLRFVRAGYDFSAQDVEEEIEEYPVGHSAAFLARARRTGHPYMTAALARVNASWDALSKDARYAAAKAGLKLGDVITKMDDTDITSYEDLVAAKKSYSAGDTVTLTVYREGKTMEVELTFDAVPESAETNNSDQSTDNSYNNGNGYYSDGSNGSYSNPWDFFNNFFGYNG